MEWIKNSQFEFPHNSVDIGNNVTFEDKTETCDKCNTKENIWDMMCHCAMLILCVNIRQLVQLLVETSIEVLTTCRPFSFDRTPNIKLKEEEQQEIALQILEFYFTKKLK